MKAIFILLPIPAIVWWLIQVTPIDFTPVIQLGAVGAVLAWFMFKFDPRIRALEDGQDRLTRAILLDVLSREGHPSAKAQAQNLLTEVETAEKDRKKS